MGTPFVIVGTGQSNMFSEPPFAWTPNPRAKIWNQTRDVDNAVGTAFQALPSSTINVASYYAHLVATADPNKDVYLINLSRGSMDIGHWVPGIVYSWETAVGGAPSAGSIRRNNASPASINQFNISKTDKFGSQSWAHPASAANGLKIKVQTASGLRVFTCSGSPVDQGTYFTVPVTYVSGTASATAGADVSVAVSPDFYAAALAVIPAALAKIAGKSTVDMMMWWQGENDAAESATMSRWKQEFEFFYANLKAQSFYPAATELLLMGVVSNAISGLSTMDAMNTALQQTAAVDATHRDFCATAQNLGSTYWTATVHMTAEGYRQAALLAFNNVYAPPLVPAAPVDTTPQPPPAAPKRVDMASIMYRNADDSGWLDLSKVAGFYVRNAADTAWLDAKALGLRFRTADDQAWFNPIVSVEATSAWTVVMDISSNPAHQPGGVGLWVDGPMQPYRGGDGNVYFFVCNGTTNYRFKVPNFLSGGTWVLDGPVYSPSQDLEESHYDNRKWLFGVWAEGNKVTAICHHEWYYSVGGTIDMTPPNVHQEAGVDQNYWIIHPNWAQSQNSGGAFAPWPVATSQRAVMVPEPYLAVRKTNLIVNGWEHTSNVAKEGSWYYCFVDTLTNPLDTSKYGDTGVVLIRGQNLDSPLGWQFWGGTGWVNIDHGTWQGGSSPSGAAQAPYLFFKELNINPYTTLCDNFAGQCIRYHVPSSQWVLFGFSPHINNGNTSNPGGGACYSVSPTLANPQFDLGGTVRPKPIILNNYTAGSDYGGFHYMGVFDPAFDNSDNQNFQKIGNTPQLWTGGANQAQYRVQNIKLNIA